MRFCYTIHILLCSYIFALENDKSTENTTTSNNLVPINPDVANKSEFIEKNDESPAESDLFEKINHVVDEFNNYRDNFLVGNKREDAMTE